MKSIGKTTHFKTVRPLGCSESKNTSWTQNCRRFFRCSHRFSAIRHRMGVSENRLCTPKANGFADHYPYEKWLFHWEYTLFSDKPGISSVASLSKEPFGGSELFAIRPWVFVGCGKACQRLVLQGNVMLTQIWYISIYLYIYIYMIYLSIDIYIYMCVYIYNI